MGSQEDKRAAKLKMRLISQKLEQVRVGRQRIHRILPGSPFKKNCVPYIKSKRNVTPFQNTADERF